MGNASRLKRCAFMPSTQAPKTASLHSESGFAFARRAKAGVTGQWQEIDNVFSWSWFLVVPVAIHRPIPLRDGSDILYILIEGIVFPRPIARIPGFVIVDGPRSSRRMRCAMLRLTGDNCTRRIANHASNFLLVNADLPSGVHEVCRTVQDIVVEVVAPDIERIVQHGQEKRRARLESVDTIDLPTLQQQRLGSTQALAERQFIRQTYRYAMPQIEIRVTTIGGKIVGVLNGS